jgi:hypothetical protein
MKGWRISVLLVVTCWAGSALAQGAWLCRDENGHSSLQDSPCPERKRSGIKPVTATAIDEKVMRETMKRMVQIEAQRDSAAYLALYSRSLKETSVDYKGNKGKSNYAALERTTNTAFDAADVAETFTCKVAAPPTPETGALQCVVTGNAAIFGRTIKGEVDKTFEFGIENGEVKIVSTHAVQSKANEVKR